MSAANNQATNDINIIDNYDLSHANTFGMKVTCAQYVAYSSVPGLRSALTHIGTRPFIHLGAGSNILFTAEHYDGVVLHSSITDRTVVAETDTHLLLRVGAGVTFDDLIADVCQQQLWGVENLSGIPGEVGASAVQNVGAYGVEAKDVIVEVECVDTATGDVVTFTNAECGYGYRDSRFKHEKNRYIVTYVTYRLSKIAAPRLNYGNLASAVDAASATPQCVRDAVIDIRNQKLPRPGEIGSAGSFFKNPVVDAETFAHAKALSQRDDMPFYAVGDKYKIPAAWLIEQCGLKGKTLGNAAVWHLQPLVLVNATGNARADEIIALENNIIHSVETKFGLTLSAEVEHV